jgi:preprotein translocase subunit YajC
MPLASGHFCWLSPHPYIPNGCSRVFPSLCLCLLLAQDQAPQNPNAFLQLVAPMAVIMLLFYFMLLRPQKRKEQELRDMVHNLKENDRVVTIGGIYGVVTNVQRDAERVTIRVDEATGTKIRVNMSAVARVLTGDDQESGSTSSKS